MEHEKFDPYYRDLPANLIPARTPFTRSRQLDVGQLFIYLTNKGKRWSLLLNRACIDTIYEDARNYIPRGISQFWLLEKRYSTFKPPLNTTRTHPRMHPYISPRSDRAHATQPQEIGKTLVVLREPEPSPTRQSDIVSYHLVEAEAVTAAETYTRRHHRRAVVGALLWDEPWW